MESFLGALNAMIAEDAELSYRLTGGVWTNEAPANVPYPFLIVTAADGEEDGDTDDESWLEHHVVQFTAGAADSEHAYRIGRLVRSRLSKALRESMGQKLCDDERLIGFYFLPINPLSSEERPEGTVHLSVRILHLTLEVYET